MTRRRAWRRAAIALDDYRELAGADNLDTITVERPANPALRSAHSVAWKALEEHDAARRGERSACHER